MHDFHQMCILKSELKNLAANVFKSVNQELIHLRQQLEIEVNSLKEEIEVTRINSAENDNKLSRFVEAKMIEANKSTNIELGDFRDVILSLAEKIKYQFEEIEIKEKNEDEKIIKLRKLFENGNRENVKKMGLELNEVFGKIELVLNQQNKNNENKFKLFCEKNEEVLKQIVGGCVSGLKEVGTRLKEQQKENLEINTSIYTRINEADFEYQTKIKDCWDKIGKFVLVISEKIKEVEIRNKIEGINQSVIQFQEVKELEKNITENNKDISKNSDSLKMNVESLKENLKNIEKKIQNEDIKKESILKLEEEQQKDMNKNMINKNQLNEKLIQILKTVFPFLISKIQKMSTVQKDLIDKIEKKEDTQNPLKNQQELILLKKYIEKIENESKSRFDELENLVIINIKKQKDSWSATNENSGLTGNLNPEIINLSDEIKQFKQELNQKLQDRSVEFEVVSMNAKFERKINDLENFIATEIVQGKIQNLNDRVSELEYLDNKEEGTNGDDNVKASAIAKVEKRLNEKWGTLLEDLRREFEEKWQMQQQNGENDENYAETVMFDSNL